MSSPDDHDDHQAHDHRAAPDGGHGAHAGHAGSVVAGGSLRVRVTATGDRTALSGITSRS